MNDAEDSQQSGSGLQQIRFTPGQAKTIASSLTLLATSVVLAFCAVVLWVIVVFCSAFSGVLMPIVVAAVLTLLLKPFYNWLHEKRKLKPFWAVAVIVLSIVLPLLFIMGFAGFVIFTQLVELIEKVPGWYQKLVAVGVNYFPQVQSLWYEYEVGPRLTDFMETNTAEIIARVQAIAGSTFKAGVSATSWVGGLLGWLMVPIYLVFFLTLPTFKASDLESGLPFFKPQTRKNVVYLFTEFFAILVTFFRGQLVVALAQGVLYAFGFWAIGLEFGLAIGFALGLLNIIPYLGNIVGLAVALPTAYFQPGGGWELLALTILVFIVVQVVEGMILTPKIMGDKTGLHPVAIIVAILFWGTALDGILGMILGIPLTAFLVVFWRLLREKYIRELV
ncbi:MAG: AI-2E family transporter [Verrucomicrobiota bacterium]